jgi:Fe-S-cluster containining protein
MKINIKLNILHQINQIYEDYIKSYDLACERLCAHCCTRNVTMTTLEGFKIVKYLESSNKTDLLKKIKADEERFGYKPRITTNQMAQMGYEGKDIPEENFGDNAGEAMDFCPVLENDECPIYEARPFGCRCLVSKHNCKDKGYAQIDPFVVTVNNIIFQFIEHIDESGLFGNFSDVLIFMENKKASLNDTSEVIENIESGLLKNHPLSVLLIPPEHREQIKPILESLQNIKVPKGL